MAHSTTTPDAPVAFPLLVSDRPARAAAIRFVLDDATALINTQHAAVLASVIEMKEQNLHRSEF